MTKLKPNQIYAWEMETADGVVLKQFEKDGKENTWKSLDPEKVVRITMTPSLPVFPTHTVTIDHSKGEKFVRRFARGFMKSTDGFNLSEYVNCIVTNRYRLWVFADGKCILTNVEYELYI